MFMVNINDSSTWIPDGDNEVWACCLCRCVVLFISTTTPPPPPPAHQVHFPALKKDEEFGVTDDIQLAIEVRPPNSHIFDNTGCFWDLPALLASTGSFGIRGL